MSLPEEKKEEDIEKVLQMRQVLSSKGLDVVNSEKALAIWQKRQI